MVKPRLTYANVMSTFAALLAFAGGAVAYASHLEVRSTDIVDGQVKTKDLNRRASVAKVDGSSIRQISYRAPQDTDPGPEWDRLFQIKGLTAHAYCPSEADDRVYIRVRTSTNNSIVGSGALNAKTYGGADGDAMMFPAVNNDSDAGEESFLEIDDTVTVLSYGRGNAGSPVVTATFLANQWVGGDERCSIIGTVVHSG